MATDTSRTRPSETCVPPAGTLSLRQLRGADCVFCGITLTARTAVSLGVRDRPEATGHWFPRACRSHTEAEAEAVPATRPIPPVIKLNHDQRQGWACVWCRVLLDEQTTGAHHVGYSRGKQGAHTLDCEAWSCTTCERGSHHEDL
ncbi:hypothetical protein [Streptomyces sp. NPDC048442]|uniref:hypothetical protein n=1 Tax=Streptomyces sp. NPDC048442 TaxID=3154823 RepID=UPI00343846CC